MDALIVVDAQNEFAAGGHRTVPNHVTAFAAVRQRVAEARAARLPIAWIQHHNLPDEWPAFKPGSPGAALGPGLSVDATRDEILFQKQVFGAFTGTGLEEWLRQRGVRRVMLVGFYVHMCLSTTSREALVRGFEVTIDPNATGGVDLTHPLLGTLSADEVRRTALLQLSHMGVVLTAESSSDQSASGVRAPAHAQS